MSAIKQHMSLEDVKVKSSVSLYDGFCKVKGYKISHRYFDRSWSPEYIRECLVRERAVGAILYDPARNQVVLIEQFRVGAMESGVNPWLIEIVAGISDKYHYESDEELIRREVFEESGLEVEELLYICDYLVSPGCSSEKVGLFCGKVDSSKAKKFCGVRDEHEDIKVHVLKTQDAFHAVATGQINNGFTIIALQWLELNIEKVNKLWLE